MAKVELIQVRSLSASHEEPAKVPEDQPKPVAPKKPHVNPIFESRASAMLRAALSDKNKKENKAPVSSQPTIPAYRPLPKPVRSYPRKRSPNNNVIFTDPVVTQEFSYEPTDLDQQEEGAEENNAEEDIIAKKISTEQKIISESYIQATNRDPDKLFNSHLDDDHGEDLYQTTPMKRYTCPESIKEKPSSKRPHSSLQDEQTTQVAKRTPLSRSDSGSGGLFSSPKVAKIAPYFDDRLNEKRGHADKNCNRANRHHQRPKVPPRAHHGNNKHIPNNRRIVSAQNNSTELLAYNRKPNNELVQTSEPIKSEESIITSQGYIGSWLSSGWNFISAQVNKLIF